MARDPQIDKLINDAKTKQFRDGEAKGLIASIGDEIKAQLAPLFSGFSKEITAAVKDSLANVKINVPKSDAPNVQIPDFPQFPAFPEMKAPIVNLPAPIVNVPAPHITVSPTPVTFPSEMSLRNGDKPFPVILSDVNGKPFQFPSAGASGGRADFFAIRDIQTSSGASVIDQVEGAIKVVGSFSVAASNSSTHIIDSSNNIVGSVANPLNVALVSGAASSTKAQIGNSDGDFSSANPLPVTFSAAASQNVNVFDGQASTVSSHQDPTGDFRGLDVTNLRTLNYISNYNSTTATLAGNGAFTGLAEDIKDYSVVQVNVFADQVSATDGLSVQQSSDGSNWDITDVYTIPASTGKTFSFQVAARYFRVVYTNGATIQGAFRIQAVLHQTVSKNSSQRPGDGLSNENDFEQVSAYLAALNGSGTWDRLHTGGFDSLGALRTSQATDSVSSVVINSGTITTVTNITNSVATVLTDSTGVAYSGSNPVPTTATIALPSGPGDGATATRFIQAGDTVSSTNILQINGSTPATGLNETTAGVLRVTIMTDTAQSANVTAFNGNAPATGLNETTPGVLRTVQMTDSVSSVVINSGTLTTLTTLTGVTNTVNVRLDTPDGIVTSANPFPVALASGGLDSTFVLMARTTNPTAVSDGADVRPKADKLGRQLTRPYQVRDLIKTAYVALTTGTEATLLTAAAGTFADLIMITATNNSTAATQLDIRATTAGNIIHTMYLPASTGPVGFAPLIPWPQDSTGNSWTIDMPDQTGTTVYVSALFSQEI